MSLADIVGDEIIAKFKDKRFKATDLYHLRDAGKCLDRNICNTLYRMEGFKFIKRVGREVINGKPTRALLYELLAKDAKSYFMFLASIREGKRMHIVPMSGPHVNVHRIK